MALLKLGALAQDVRGSLNGSVFSRNRGGAYVRTKVSPVQPVSAFSSAARMMFAAISQLWSTNLTDVQRAGWEAFAATHPFVNVFGDAIILSGIAFYQSINRRLQQMGVAVIDDAPATFAVADLVSLAATISSTPPSALTFIIDIGRALTADETLYIFATQPLLGARTPQKNDFRLINPPSGDGYAASGDIGPDYLLRFPGVTVADGSRIALRCQAVNKVTGAASSPIMISAIATGVPGALITVQAKEKTDQGAGNVTPELVLAIAPGWNPGDTVTVALSPADATFDGAKIVNAMISPNVVQFQIQVGAVTALTASGGTAQRTA